MGVADGEGRHAGVAGNFHGSVEADSNRRIGKAVGRVDSVWRRNPCCSRRRRPMTVDFAAGRLIGVEGHPRHAVRGQPIGVRRHQGGGYDFRVAFGRIAVDQGPGGQMPRASSKAILVVLFT